MNCEGRGVLSPIQTLARASLERLPTHRTLTLRPGVQEAVFLFATMYRFLASSSKTKTLPGAWERGGGFLEPRKTKKNKPTLAIVPIHPCVRRVQSFYSKQLLVAVPATQASRRSSLHRDASPASSLAKALTKLLSSK